MYFVLLFILTHPRTLSFIIQEKSRQTWIGSGDEEIPNEVKQWKLKNITTEFTGYNTLTEEKAIVLAAWKNEKGVFFMKKTLQ